MRKTIRNISYFLLLLSLLTSACLQASIVSTAYYSTPWTLSDSIGPTEASAPQEKSIFDYLQRDTALSLKIELNLQKYLDLKSIDVYLPAQMHLQNEAGEWEQIPLRVKARGKSRRQFCHFPPMKLKFFEDWLATNHLAAYTDIKLVTHCRTAMEYRDVVLREYLVYKMLEVMTGNSFRVQLARIEFVDFYQKKPGEYQYAMLLEPAEQLAHRLEGRLMEQRGLLSKYVLEEELTFIAMFQYFIGNTDWELDRQHNVKYIKCPKIKQLKAIPYDFDVSGVVNAAYAIPAAHLPIEHVQERLFLGKCVSVEAFEKAILPFKKYQKELLAVVEGFEPLSQRQRKKMLKFLHQFYEDIERKDFIEKQLLGDCKREDKE
ncbi:MAG: hypothetical protein AAF985_17360 [Bacteroidota bacterium]